MIIVSDPTTAARQLADGHHFACPWDGCSGWLGPWGSAHTRPVGCYSGGVDVYTPKGARCRACERTQVLVPASTFPKRADSVETVLNAIAMATNGAGHRTIAARVGLPETTVRGWLRRARANAETIRANATIAMCALDRAADKIAPTGTQLGDMLEAVGRAAMAWNNQHPDQPEAIPRLELAALLTGGELLKRNPTRLIYWPPS